MIYRARDVARVVGREIFCSVKPPLERNAAQIFPKSVKKCLRASCATFSVTKRRYALPTLQRKHINTLSGGARKILLARKHVQGKSRALVEHSNTLARAMMSKRERERERENQTSLTKSCRRATGFRPTASSSSWSWSRLSATRESARSVTLSEARLAQTS